MAGLFGGPKPPSPLPTPNPADTQNRINQGIARQLQAGGTNADSTNTGGAAAVGGARLPTLTGLG